MCLLSDPVIRSATPGSVTVSKRHVLNCMTLSVPYGSCSYKL